MNTFQEPENKSSFKIISISVVSIVFIVIFSLMYGLYRYVIKPREYSGKHPVLTSTASQCLLTYDTASISESDAKIAYVILEKTGYFTPRMPGRKASFFIDSNNVYSFKLTVKKKAMENPEILKKFHDALGELRSSFPRRQYQFILMAYDSTHHSREKKILRLK